MAKRQFEIQGSTLRIGGVDLEAGTTGVVIPGVTQATNYRVEEVEETGDQTQTFSGTVTVIDKVTYDSYVASGSSTGKATYNVDLKGNGKIDEIEVTNEGTYTSAQANTNKNNDLYAYTGSNVIGPFVSSDWATIPFRPKMRAKDVESLGGGGGGAESLEDLNDVNISDLEDGNMLRWDADAEEWINSSVPTATTSQLGAVKPDGTTITITNNGVISAVGGSGTGAPTPYKGFRAHYGRMYNSEPTLSKVVIYQDTVSPTSSIDLSTEDDTFSVTGLSGSSIVALFVIAGSDNNNPESLVTLKTFVETIIDNVILDNGQEGSINNIDDMKNAFYNNFSTISSNAGSLYSNFEFWKDTWTATNPVSTVVREGSGAVFDITNDGAGAYSVSVFNGGTGYVIGHKILISGALTGGTSPDNDIIITVQSIGVGGAISTTSHIGTAVGTSSNTYTGLTGSNYAVGSGLQLDRIRKNNDGTLTIDNINTWGNNYVVGDIIDISASTFSGLTSPDNDLVMTVTSIGAAGEPYGYTLSGTILSQAWPDNSINDGGSDQYDTGNYINTDLASNIIYNNGNSVSNASEFGGGDYVVVYQDSIFGIMTVNASINTIGTDGGSGFDGDGNADTGDLYGGGLSLGDFNFSDNIMTVTNGAEDMVITAPDDMFIQALADDIHLRADDDIRLMTGYNFTDNNYSWLWQFNTDGNISIGDNNNNYGNITAQVDGSDRVLVFGGESESWIRSNFNSYTWKFDKNGTTQIPGLIQGNGNVNISIDGNFTAANQLFRFRGGDVASHLHFDTSDSSQFDLYVGDDYKYVKVSKEGTIDIGTRYNPSGTDYRWQFDTLGQLNVPGAVIGAYTAPIGTNVTGVRVPDGFGTNNGVVYVGSSGLESLGDLTGYVITREQDNVTSTIIQMRPELGGSPGFEVADASFFQGGYTYKYTSPGYTAPQPTDLVLKSGTNQIRLNTSGDLDHSGKVRTFKPIDATVGDGVSGTIWNTILDVQAVKCIVHGVEATTGKSQSCEVLITKDANDDLAISVYAIVYTSTEPLYTLDAAYDSGTGVTRLDATVAGANNVNFTVHVTAIYYD